MNGYMNIKSIRDTMVDVIKVFPVCKGIFNFYKLHIMGEAGDITIRG